jgi:hypothetical protein
MLKSRIGPVRRFLSNSILHNTSYNMYTNQFKFTVQYRDGFAILDSEGSSSMGYDPEAATCF